MPTSIPETSMAHSNYESLQESKDSNSLRSMEVLPHVPQKVLDIKDEEENQTLANWIQYRGYDNFTDICADFYHILDRTHDYSEFRADGLRKCSQAQHHEQDQNIHLLHGYKNDRCLFLTLC